MSSRTGPPAERREGSSIPPPGHPSMPEGFPASEGKGSIVDFVYLAIVLVFFGLSQGFVALVDRSR